MTVPVAVLASGGGTNLEALLTHERTSPERGGRNDPRWRIDLVVSDREEAGALERGRRADRATAVIPVNGRPLEDVARDLLAEFRSREIGVVALAGYLRLVPAPVVEAYRARILNIHPSLLPAFGGKGMYGRRVHQAVLESGNRVTGVTVHFVDERYDRGPILAQWPVPARSSDTPETLAARVQRVEHRFYPLALDHVCRAVEEGREPDPFDPPGDAFLSGRDVREDEIIRQFREAFGEP